MTAQTDPRHPQTLDEAYQLILDDLLQTFLKKHADYGKGNILELEELGITFRLSEKVSRLKELLMKHKEPTNEPIEDTWTDIAVYAILAKLYRRGWFQELTVQENAPQS